MQHERELELQKQHSGRRAIKGRLTTAEPSPPKQHAPAQRQAATSAASAAAAAAVGGGAAEAAAATAAVVEAVGAAAAAQALGAASGATGASGATPSTSDVSVATSASSTTAAAAVAGADSGVGGGGDGMDKARVTDGAALSAVAGAGDGAAMTDATASGAAAASHVTPAPIDTPAAIDTAAAAAAANTPPALPMEGVLSRRPAYVADLTDDVLLDEPEDHDDVIANIAEDMPPMPDIFNRGESVYLLLPPTNGSDPAYQQEQWDVISTWLYAEEPAGGYKPWE